MTALQVRAKGPLYAFCPTCKYIVHYWPYGTAITVPQIILAEQRHLDEVHPQPVPDYDALHDGLHEGDEQ